MGVRKCKGKHESVRGRVRGGGRVRGRVRGGGRVKGRVRGGGRVRGSDEKRDVVFDLFIDYDPGGVSVCVMLHFFHRE